ncbi:MAG: GNAT family N-acetyltransferase [Candidatus Nanopelagicales bacterium]
MTLSVPQSRSADGTGGTLRVLKSEDLPALRALLRRDPDAYVVVSERIEAGALIPAASGGQSWGWFTGAGLESAIYLGANTIPIETTEASRWAFAQRLTRGGRRSSAIVGHHHEVLPLWELLAASWGPCREIRGDQPLMALEHTPEHSVDFRVKVADEADLEPLMPASIAMFTEEVGVSPVSGGREAGYRARLLESIRAGRVFTRIERGEVIFKAEVGAVSTASSQLQGVWVTPRLRQTGLAAPAVAGVVRLSMLQHARRISLYANAHNTAALRTYARVGFRQTGTFATVLF